MTTNPSGPRQNGIPGLSIGTPIDEAGHVVLIGQLKRKCMSKIIELSPDNLDVVLTRKSREHYLRKHPEMAEFEDRLPEVISSPTEVWRVFADPQKAIFVKKISSNGYLMAGLILDPTGKEKKHSVLTYYRLNPRTHKQLKNKGEQVWP